MVGVYECQSEILISYYEMCLQLLKEFKDFCLEHIPRLHNEEANRLAQHASGYQHILEAFSSAIDTDDWRTEIINYLLVQKLFCKHKGLIPDSNVKACQPI